MINEYCTCVDMYINIPVYEYSNDLFNVINSNLLLKTLVSH